jgi:hypothetical protein
MNINHFSHEGLEKAAFFLTDHDSLTPKEILLTFADQFGESLDPGELIMGLTVLFNIIPNTGA